MSISFSTLRAVTERVGRLDLSGVADMTVPEARAWLESLPGVGPKTSAAVLSFSALRRRALPVDSHHHRVAQRLGLIPASLAVGPAQLERAHQPADAGAHDHDGCVRHATVRTAERCGEGSVRRRVSRETKAPRQASGSHRVAGRGRKIRTGASEEAPVWDSLRLG